MKVYMFHYVTKNFNYYHFNVEKFDEVIKKLSKTKKIITLKDLKILINKGQYLNDDYIILTFDDGTIDHYKYVYPILKKYGVSGVFFICSNIIEANVLDIHLIHKLLSVASINDIYFEVNKYIKENNLHEYIKDVILNKESNYKEVYIKQMLQTLLPQKERKILLDKLVDIYNISINYKDYYLSKENIFEMKKNNMEFGCHTDNHKRLEYLSKKEQKEEIKNNLNILYKNKILEKDDIVSIAYPFGSYNECTLEVINELKIDFAFTTKEGSVKEIKNYEILRYDCNKLKE